jgi:Fic family protein
MTALSEDNIYRIEPLVSGAVALEAKAAKIWEESAALDEAVDADLAEKLLPAIRAVTSFSSNLIEKYWADPGWVIASLRGEMAAGESIGMQLYRAHLRAISRIEEKVVEGGSICRSDFLCFAHGLLFDGLPGTVADEASAGKLRAHNVAVGSHVAISHEYVEKFLHRFHHYEAKIVPWAVSLPVAMAAHHRLLWIHPFADGNGRLARLFTYAWMLRSGMTGTGFWSLSRGLLRRKEEYMAKLKAADGVREGNHDGRGARSEKRLTEFCDFMLDVAAEEIGFAHEMVKTPPASADAVAVILLKGLS